MRVYIVTDSSVYEKRAELVRDFYAENGCKTMLIVSDFDHMKKRKLSETEKRSDRIYIDTRIYKKNLSVKRLYYHHDFAKKTYELIKNKILADEENDVLLYILIPGNSLAKAGARLKKETDCRLITDIIDLWPESLPVRKIEGMLPIHLWKGIRDKSLKTADHIVTECEFYKRILRLEDDRTSVIYWPKQEIVELLDNGGMQACSGSAEGINIAYIGSVNNIIDIPKITSLLTAINKRRSVRLCVIGDGESREVFLKALGDAKISFTYHGAVYDEAKKQKLLQTCEWGLNIMKPTVKVGLTMKSIDYLANGLKLINSIEGDTWEFVDKYRFGVNIGEYTADSTEAAAEKIVSYRGASREAIHEFFKANFSVEAMYSRMRETVL